MRYLLATGTLALLLAGTSALALANPTAVSPGTSAVASGLSVSAPTKSEPSERIVSPDVAEWTATLVHEQAAASAHRGKERRGISRLAGRILARTTTIARNLTRSALRFLGTPYVFGGTSGAGFDCSGFVQHVYAMLGVRIPRTADAQYYAEHRVKGKMKPGDLVFFQTYEPGPSHVGIYLGSGKFVHASSSHGVMVSSLSDSYWSARYIGAKRVSAQL